MEKSDTPKIGAFVLEKLIRPAEKELTKSKDRIKTGMSSKKEQETYISKIDNQIQKLGAGLVSERSDEEQSRIKKTKKELEKVKKTLENETNFTAQNLNTSLDRKQRKVIKEILEVLYEALGDKEFETAREAILKKYQIDEKDNK